MDFVKEKTRWRMWIHFDEGLIGHMAISMNVIEIAYLFMTVTDDFPLLLNLFE